MSGPKFIASADMVASIGPVTRRELDTLRAERETPTRALQYDIGGSTEQIIKKFDEETRRVRESYVENRLERVAGRPSNDFARAELRGKATHDFGHG
jgi:hypothetical protein